MARNNTNAHETPQAPVPVVERETHPLLTATYWRNLARNRLTWIVLVIAAEMLALSLLAPNGRNPVGLGQLLLLKLVGAALLASIYVLYLRVRPVLHQALGANMWVNRLVTVGLAGVYASTILFVIAVGVPPLEGGPVPIVQELVGTIGVGLALAGGALSYVLTK